MSCKFPKYTHCRHHSLIDVLYFSQNTLLFNRSPLFIRDFEWPAGICDGGLMKTEHDMAVLTSLGTVASVLTVSSDRDELW